MEQNDYTSLNARNNGYTTLNCLLTARGLGEDVYIVGCNIVGKARMEHVATSYIGACWKYFHHNRMVCSLYEHVETSCTLDINCQQLFGEGCLSLYSLCILLAKHVWNMLQPVTSVPIENTFISTAWSAVCMNMLR